MRLSLIFSSALFLLTLAGCGGGGGGSDSGATQTSSNVGTSNVTTQNPASSTPQQPVVASATPNILAVHVGGGPTNTINMLFATVTICKPGTTTCQSIDHVLVDTGSTGLRLLSSALDPSMNLQKVAAPNGNTLTECMQFADGWTWGPLAYADVKLAGEVAHSIPIQIIGDPAFATVPTSCSSTGTGNQSQASLASNGILGIGMWKEDCGAGCINNAYPGVYYSCVGGTCGLSTAPLASQAQNPVVHFTSDNNGTLVQLPGVPLTGQATTTGSLIFGIGTQSNNTLGSASVFPASPTQGYISTVYNGTTYSSSFIDSGSNGIYFHDTSITKCASGFYCPNSPQVLTATNQGVSGSARLLSFTMLNADQLFANNSSYLAFSTLAGDFPGITNFDWGLPFFFGRNVFTAIEGQATPGGTGPYFAY